MKILYFSRDYTPHDHRFLTSLAAHGLEVHYMQIKTRTGPLDQRELPPGVNIIDWYGAKETFRWSRLPLYVATLRQVLKNLQPDLVHAGPIPNVGFLAAISGFRPLVSMSWGSDLLLEVEQNAWLRLTARSCLQRTTVLVADCDAVRLKAERLGLPTERTVLFPWGVDLELFSPHGEKDPSVVQFSKKRFTLLSVRSWEPIYGVDLLVRAFCMAAQQNPNIVLVLAGSGSLADKIHAEIQRHEMQTRVLFLNQVPNDALPRIYRAADLYLSASRSDGSSVSLMEALACGMPVLVSDIPGNAEWISHGKQGWLFPDGDVDALAGGILAAEKTPIDKRRRIGSAGRTLAEERADWGRNFQQLLRAYQMALDLTEKNNR